MKSQVSPRWLLVPAAVLALALPLPAAESPLDQVPAGTPFIVQIHGVQRTKDRLKVMLEHAFPDQAEQMQNRIDDFFHKALKGRELKGLEPSGPIFLVCTALPEPEGNAAAQKQDVPHMAFILHVSDYDEFRDGLLKPDERKSLTTEKAGCQTATLDDGKKVYFLQRGDYAIVTPRQDVVEQFLKQSGSIQLSDPLRERLLGPDFAVYVDMKQINAKYGKQIQHWRESFETLFNPQNGGVKHIDQQTAAQARMMISLLFDAVRDSTAVVEGVKFQRDGLAWHAEADIKPDSATQRVLKNFHPTPLQELSSLPAGQLGYTAMQMTPDLFKLCARTAIHGFESDEQGKQFQKAVDQAAAAGPQWMIQAWDLPLRAVEVWQFEEPNKAVSAEFRLLEALQPGTAIKSLVLKEKPEVQAYAENYRGFVLNRARLTWDLDRSFAQPTSAKDTDQAPMRDALKRMIGPETLVWFGTDGKRFVKVGAADWTKARELLDSYLDGKDTLGRAAAFEECRKHLPKEANMLSLIDGPRYFRCIAENWLLPQWKVHHGGKSEVSLPPAGQLSPSYIGSTIGLQETRISMDVWMPGTGAGEIYKVFAPFFQTAQQPAKRD